MRSVMGLMIGQLSLVGRDSLDTLITSGNFNS